MIIESGDYINLTSSNQEGFGVLSFDEDFNFDNIKSPSYKQRIINEFYESFDHFIDFFSKKFSIKKNKRLKNFLKPWWLQAVFFKLDRQDLANTILKKGIKSFICDDQLEFIPFYNHTDIKNKIGNDSSLNNFFIALLLKEERINFNLAPSPKNQNFFYTGNKFYFVNKAKNLLQIIITAYVKIFSKLFLKRFQIITDTSNYSRKYILINTIKCNFLPFIEQNDCHVNNHRTKRFIFENINSNDFLFEIFSSRNLLENFHKFRLGKQNASSVKTHKGYLNNLYTRSFITANLNDNRKIQIYPHGGLNHALWTEEQMTGEICKAEYKNIKINPNESKYSVNTNNNCKHDLLVTLFGHTKFVSRFRSGMTHHEYSTEYLKNVDYFLRYLDQEKYKVKLRLPIDNRANKNLILMYEDLGYEIDQNHSINESLSQSRIHIPTYNATLPIYSIINNIPSLFFWNDNHFPLPKKFDEIINSLKKENLLFNDSDDLINYINNVSVKEIKNNWQLNSELIKIFGNLILDN